MKRNRDGIEANVSAKLKMGSRRIGEAVVSNTG